MCGRCFCHSESGTLAGWCLKNRCQFSENKTFIEPDLKNVKGEKNMTIISKRNSGKGNHNRWGLFFISLVISVWVLPSVAQAGEIPRKFKVNNQITKMQAIPIPGSPGRAIGFYERLGDVEYEDGETAKQVLRCTFDMVRGVGPFQGYSQFTFKDGSTFLVKIEGITIKPEEGKLPTGHGTGKYVDGTGRFKGIEGNNAFKFKMLKPFGGESKGDALVEVKATYKFPGK